MVLEFAQPHKSTHQPEKLSHCSRCADNAEAHANLHLARLAVVERSSTEELEVGLVMKF